jgi:hypothetical protein
MMIREIALPVEANEKHHHQPTTTTGTTTPLSLCPHAVAVGSTVYGLLAGFDVEEQQQQQQTRLSWLSSASWKTCLATKKQQHDDDCDQNSFQ